ncbi:alpha/beta fold hydrolase [Smaragdicoccus niigatensis]|uniref:alpha/beta fold hydrolase n=1 Tax=Smaragdicoccus niigatensis TaxID=359359 RepID=UPI0003721342|nr:alpha/beta hydrolase [Smaragdicoccus niigatensis]
MTTPIVLLHGLGGSPAAWGRVRPLLDGDVIAPKLAGDSIEADADRVAEVVSAPAIVVGHSRGGLVATALAERHPELVKRLVLVNATPTRDSRISATGLSERILEIPLVGEVIWRNLPTAVVAKGLASAFAPGTPVPGQFVRDLQATRLTTFLSATRAIDAYLETSPLGARLTALSQPTQIIYGTADQRVDPAAFGALAGIDGVTVTSLPSVGHTPIWERPEAVAAAIMA